MCEEWQKGKREGRGEWKEWEGEGGRSEKKESQVHTVDKLMRNL